MEHFAGLMHGHADGGLSQQEEAVKEDGLCVPVMTNYFCFCHFASKYSSDLIRTVERHPSHESFHSLGHINLAKKQHLCPGSLKQDQAVLDLVIL